MPPKIRKGSTAAKGGKETENMCRDCRTPVHNNDKAIACDLCEHWMHAQCQDMPDATYAFLSDNEDSGINWYCNHCKVIATGVVSEVSKMAKNYQDMDKRVKKLETQIKSKANESDLEELRRELLSDMEDKVTQDTLTNLEQNIREDTENKVKKAMEELPDDIPRSEDIKRMIQEELKEHQDTESAAIGQVRVTKEENEGQLEEKVVELSKEIMDQNNRRNIIIYRLTEKHDAAYTSHGISKNDQESSQVLDLIKTVTGKDTPEAITKCTRLGKASQDRSRPLLVMFRDTATKDNFMDNLKQLKGSKYQNVSIAHDMTKTQREELAKKVAEAKAKEEQESGDWEYRVVGHPSRWQIKRRKKREATGNNQTTTATQEEKAESLTVGTERR